jgi:hypothetical protein
MLDCCETKHCTDGAVAAIGSQRPMNERKVSFHRRFVESQKELKNTQAKLLHAESLTEISTK